MISKSLFLNFSIISSRLKIAEISKKETFLQSIIIFLLPFSFSNLSSKKDAVPKNKDPFTFIIWISVFSISISNETFERAIFIWVFNDN